jgi:hypothetical protein
MEGSNRLTATPHFDLRRAEQLLEMEGRDGAVQTGWRRSPERHDGEWMAILLG